MSITPTAANTPTSVTVTFPTQFSSTPSVIASADTSSPGTAVTGVSVTSITTTSCVIYLTRTNTTATTIRWVAVKVK